MQLIKTEISLPEEKVIATAGNFISLSGGKKFYEYPVADLSQFDALHLVVRSVGNSKLAVTQFGRPGQDNFTLETMLAPHLVKAITFPRLEFVNRFYFECPSPLDILGFYGVNVEGFRAFSPAKFKYRHSRSGVTTQFGRHSVVFPAGTTELGITQDSTLTLTAPRLSATVNCGQDLYHFVGTISMVLPKDVVSILISSDEAVECQPQTIAQEVIPQLKVRTLQVRNEYH